MIQQTVNTYFERFNAAKTIVDKHHVANEFKTYYDGLNPTDRAEGRKAMQPFLDAIKKGFDNLDQTTGRRAGMFKEVA